MKVVESQAHASVRLTVIDRSAANSSSATRIPSTELQTRKWCSPESSFNSVLTPAGPRPARASGSDGNPRSRWVVTRPETGGPFDSAARTTEARSACGVIGGSWGVEEARAATATTAVIASASPSDALSSRILTGRAILYL